MSNSNEMLVALIVAFDENTALHFAYAILNLNLFESTDPILLRKMENSRKI